MEEAVDGEYQAYKANDGAFVRQHFFGKHDELKKLVSNLSDEDIWRLNRGGHDPHKVFGLSSGKQSPGTTYCNTVQNSKRLRNGDAGEGKNITHQQKKMNLDSRNILEINLKSQFQMMRSRTPRTTNQTNKVKKCCTSRNEPVL